MYLFGCFFWNCVRQPNHARCLELWFAKSCQCPVCRHDYQAEVIDFRRSEHGARRFLALRNAGPIRISMESIAQEADAALDKALAQEAEDQEHQTARTRQIAERERAAAAAAAGNEDEDGDSRMMVDLTGETD